MEVVLIVGLAAFAIGLLVGWPVGHFGKSDHKR